MRNIMIYGLLVCYKVILSDHHDLLGFNDYLGDILLSKQLMHLVRLEPLP
jgi:hypothetical protein